MLGVAMPFWIGAGGNFSIKKIIQHMKKLVLLPLFLLGLFAFTSVEDQTCPTPSNVQKLSNGPGSINFDWDDAAPSYQVWCQKIGGFSSQVFETSTSGYNYTGLSSGNYKFYFRSVCEGGEQSGIIVIEETVIQ